MVWQFTNPVQVVFGPGSVSQLPDLASWSTTLLIASPGASRRGTTDHVLRLLAGRKVTVYDQVDPEPQISSLEDAVASLGTPSFEGIVGIGGGSVIDTAKILSHLLGGPTRQLRRHLEEGVALSSGARLPVVAVPTTAGTGSEVTPFATIWDSSSYRKYSFAASDLYPRAALLDPELTMNVPRDLTLSTGLDALCQGLESLWSRNSNPATASFALQAVSVALEFLPRVVVDLGNLEVRGRMLEASLLAGLAISSTRTTLPHSISYPLTMRFGVPHGLACAFSLAQVLRFNAESNKKRLTDIANALGFSTPNELATRLDGLMERTGALKWLAELMPLEPDFLAIAPEAVTPGRADNNPRNASTKDIEDILAGSWTVVSKYAG